MRLLRHEWLTHSGEKKDFEIYSCHVSPDGERLVTAGGGKYSHHTFHGTWLTSAQMVLCEYGRRRPRAMPTPPLTPNLAN